MTIVEIETKEGNTIGAVQFYKNKENEEIQIQQVQGNISIADIDGDDLFDTNDKKIRIQISESEEWEMVFKDYVELTNRIYTYGYIAEKDIDYWYYRAKDDEYDQYLISLCETYGIELDYHALEQDNIQEEIYDMEILLINEFKKLLGIK